MNDTTTDEVIIQNILNGKKADEKLLYDRYKKIIEDYIISKYKNIPEHEDCVSEIMIKIFVNLKNFDINKSKFKTWAISVLKNYMTDRWRESNASISTCNYPISYLDSDTCCDYTLTAPREYFSTSYPVNTKFDYANTLSYLSSQMSDEDYELLDLKYNQGFNYNEIGTMFNMSSCTVSNRVNYLKLKLKRDNPEISI